MRREVVALVAIAIVVVGLIVGFVTAALNLFATDDQKEGGGRQFYADERIWCFEDNPFLDGQSGSCYTFERAGDGSKYLNETAQPTCEFSWRHVASMPAGCWP